MTSPDGEPGFGAGDTPDGRELPAHEAYAALLSHELRTPVTAIFGYLQLLQDDRLLDDPQLLRQYLTVVRGRAADLARIVSELTAFTDLVQGRAPAASRSPHTLPAALEQVAAGRPLRLQVTSDAAGAAIDLDRLQLVLQTLLDNAFRHGTPGREVLVQGELAGEPPRLVVRVTNEGPLIPAALREEIFQPFRGEDRPERLVGGLRLGLTVARLAAEGAGGTLVLEPAAPTTFRLELPLREDPVARQARALREQLTRADAQALRAIQDLRSLRQDTERERRAREQAEAQQVRLAMDFRAEHRRAVELAQRLDAAYLATITALARSVEARDSYTGGHVERVRRYSLWIAEHLGVQDEALRHIEFGAVLHDVGKIGVPDAVLAKTKPLSPREWRVMRSHPEIGRRVLEGIALLAPALDAVSHHHERWDGQGYPAGLAGEAIPAAGRIVSVADAYDAVTSGRPYRVALPTEVALAEIERGRGGQFDPDIARGFLEVLAQRAPLGADPPPASSRLAASP